KASSSMRRRRGRFLAAQRRPRWPGAPRETAVGRARVMARPESAERAPRHIGCDALADQLADHRDVGGMRADRRGARDLDADLARDGRGLEIEVEDDLEVIRDEADWGDDGLAHAIGREAA